MCPSLFQKNILALTPISELVTEVKSVIKWKLKVNKINKIHTTWIYKRYESFNDFF
jgi:hypothetical protein